jgi:hypothetical protein
MRDARRRPLGRLCCWGLLTIVGLELAAFGAAPGANSGLATTTVADTVYMADGSPAQGSLIITWPAFATASGAVLGAGTTSVTLDKGTFSVALVPNAGANPAGVYYTVVYQLGPGQVKTEFWVVPTSSPANLAAVRTSAGSGVAAAAASMQYVNSELAKKADDSAVVHVNGTETISGAKTFATAPSVPAATDAGQVATKGYVDQAVSNVGAGNYLPVAGGAMTGPITLASDPSSAMQASTKNYVDNGLGSKADLVSGVVPASELGSGQATAGNCLQGNGTWAPCGSGGTGNLSTNPTTSQAIAQPVGTQFTTNNLANIRYVTASWNWLQSPTDDLGTPGSATIHLSPCPLGIDTTSSAHYYTYKVYIAGKGTPEAVAVTGGSCTPGASSGTISVSTTYAHSAGYTVGSASSGIQEAWNDAWTNDVPKDATSVAAPYVKLTAGTNYSVYASVYLRGRGGILDGAGALIFCSTRDRCIYVGTTQGSPYVHHHKIYNLTGASTVNVDGVQVASVSASNGTYTISTASNHPFVVGDMVDCEYYSQTSGQHWVSQVLSVPDASTFTVTFGKGAFSAGANAFGFCNVLNTFLENNSDHVVVQDINLSQVNPGGMGYFSYGIVNDDDQHFVLERASNRSTGVVKTCPNWPMGAFLYQRTDQGNAGITYIHSSEFTNVNCATAGGNGFVISDTVCQGFPAYGVRYFGGYQPATIENVYEESTGGTVNPLYGVAAQMGYAVQGGVGTRFVGTFPTSGWEPMFATGGGAASERTYFVIPRSSTMGYGPMILAGAAQPASSSTTITVKWPSIELQDGYFHQSVGTLTWDVLVTNGQSAVTPYGTGSYALATNAAVSCGTNGMCSFTDTQNAPSSYTVPGQQFTPAFWFWPTGVVMNSVPVITDVIMTDPSAVSSQGANGVAIIAQQCQPGGSARRKSPLWVSCLASSSNYGSGMVSTVLQEQDSANNGPFANSKGRLSFGKPIGAPNDLITLADSNFAKTLATAGQRPTNDPGDMAIGTDQSGGMSQRAATSITSYINTLPSGTNFLERLTAGGKTFNVPLTVNGALNVSGNVTLPVTGGGFQCLHVNNAGVVSGTGADCGNGGGSASGTVNAGSTSQVAMYTGNGTAVSGDSVLTDNGTTLNYQGIGGISTTTGAFGGNLTVNGQLQVAGPWMVSSPIPGTAMANAGAGTSSMGISNDGNFYISANGSSPQKVATSATSSFFSNLWQEDPNTLGQFNGGNGQNLHVYGTYANASTFERTGLGWDANDNYFVVKNENAGTGTSQRGIGFWIGSGIRWGINTASEFKPFSNNAFDIGDAAFAPRTVYAGTSIDTLTQGRMNFELCNDATMGTSLNFLAKYNGANPACAVEAGTADTDGIIGVVSNGSGTTGNAVITYQGAAQCSFDGTATAGDYVVASTSHAGDCHDAGATRPSGLQVLGRVESFASGVTYWVRVALDAPAGGGGGGLGTVNGGSASQLAFYSASGNAVSGDSNLTDSGTSLSYSGKAVLTNTGALLDASLLSGPTLDVKLNNANAYAITSGVSTIDARMLGGVQTIASEVSIGELRPPALAGVSGTSPGPGTYKLVYTLSSPTATETSASMESTITVDGSHAIQVSSPMYAGTATAYTVYMTTAGGNSWTEAKCVGATNVAIGSSVTITSMCSGTAVSKTNIGFGVSLIPPKSGTWIVSVADTVTNTSCGLKFFDGSSFEGVSAGEGRTWSLVSNAATNVEALFCTDNNPKNVGGYYNIRGLAARGTGSDSIQTATCIMRAAFDVSRFDDMQCGTYKAGGVAALAYGATIGVGAGTRVSGNFEANSLGQPLVIGSTIPASMIGWDFNNISAVHPGNSYGNINIIGGARSIHFTGITYMEGPTSGTCSDAIQIATGAGMQGPVEFDNVNHGASCSGTTAYLFSVPNGYTLGALSVHATFTGNFSNLFRYAPDTTRSLSAVGSATTYPAFVWDKNNPTTITGSLSVVGATALGVATGVTTSASDNSTNLATTAFVKAQGYAPSTTMVNGHALSSGNVTVSASDLTTGTLPAAQLPAANWWITVPTGGGTTPALSSSSNRMKVFGVILPYAVSTSQISYYVQTADNSANTYDLGIYDSTGTLKAHTGSIAGTTLAPSAGWKTLNWSGPATLLPGRYLLAITSSCTSSCATFLGANANGITFQGSNVDLSIAQGGLCPGSVAWPADSLNGSTAIPVWQVH